MNKNEPCINSVNLNKNTDFPYLVLNVKNDKSFRSKEEEMGKKTRSKFSVSFRILKTEKMAVSTSSAIMENSIPMRFF